MKQFKKLPGIIVILITLGRFPVSAQTPAESKPNILIIITDQQSADALSLYVDKKYLNTPNIDQLANGGTLFSKAYVAHPVCIPSRTSMFTGYYPHETGVLSYQVRTLDTRKFPSLVGLFQNAGYHTGYTGKWHVPGIDISDTAISGFEFSANIKNNGADKENSDIAIEFIKQERDRPFFLVVSYNNPHNICEYARRQRLPDGSVGMPPPLDQLPPLRANHLPPSNESEIMAHMRNSYQASSTFPVGDFGEKEWREYQWAYNRMIEMVDTKIGRVLGALRESGQEENTLIVFTSDHGDMQGAHRWNQKTVFYDESARVPLIIKYPGITIVPVSDQLVHTGIDFIPTLLDFAGIPIPEALPGKSLKSNTMGDDDLKTDFIVTQTQFHQGAAIDGTIPSPSGRMVRSRRFKYTLFDMGEQWEELYDMVNDPGEMINLSGDKSYGNILNEHRQYLKDYCVETGDFFIANIPPITAAR